MSIETCHRDGCAETIDDDDDRFMFEVYDTSFEATMNTRPDPTRPLYRRVYCSPWCVALAFADYGEPEDWDELRERLG